MSKNEPLLDPQLENRLAEFRARPHTAHQLIEVVTNASALTPARYERLAAAGVDLLTISFSAHTPATFEKVMAGLSWEQVRRNLEALAEHRDGRVNVILRFVRQKDNYDEFPAFKRYWEKRGFNVLEFNMNNRAGVVHNYQDLLLPEREYFKSRIRLALGQRYIRLCPHAFSVIHVLENGDVPLCANDWDNREIVGNVQEKSLAEIYNAPPFQELRRLMRAGRYADIPLCRDCTYWQDWFPPPIPQLPSLANDL